VIQPSREAFDPWILLSAIVPKIVYSLEKQEMEVALIKSFTDKPWRSPGTYQLIEESLQEKWPVRSIHTRNAEALHKFLQQCKQDLDGDMFVFNIAEYLDEENKIAFLPKLLDEWQMPHLGSSGRVAAIGLDKERTKRLLDQYNIPTPRYFVARGQGASLAKRASQIGFPLFVKPLGEGGHIGISPDSIVYDEHGLEEAVSRNFAETHQPALVEQYIKGEGMREFSVGIIDGECRIMTPVEIDYDSMDVDINILDHKAAENDLERIMPVQDKAANEAVIDLAQRTFEAVGARDYARVDIRMNAENYYVLEINIMPGLGPHSFLPEAAMSNHCLPYDQLIQRLVETSLQRGSGADQPIAV
jgi:D-alanine-D-alanine ligase